MNRTRRKFLKEIAILGAGAFGMSMLPRVLHGSSVGSMVGSSVGSRVGSSVGSSVGSRVGSSSV